jgi:hypothetical protein
MTCHVPLLLLLLLMLCSVAPCANCQQVHASSTYWKVKRHCIFLSTRRMAVLDSDRPWHTVAASLRVDGLMLLQNLVHLSLDTVTFNV